MIRFWLGKTYSFFFKMKCAAKNQTKWKQISCHQSLIKSKTRTWTQDTKLIRKEKTFTAATTIQFIQTNLAIYVSLSHNEFFLLLPEAESLKPFFGANRYQTNRLKVICHLKEIVNVELLFSCLIQVSFTVHVGCTIQDICQVIYTSTHHMCWVVQVRCGQRHSTI